ncbi:VPLPA-CTERM sorting domain-containing protein [Palleronia sp. LCG004]|uniref:VPLPA-CTERM sorting domain-containing protein n=1 Tax=Palleronia sp. LCG004 TaxID=3079304 RepID=UPI0029420E10|nr:VPLPA-CTERM sorting domain-containing protein [Palleronia sp. LCG004]WOI56575.1 VPLPA-CTERM sorting domain-containing protein [Palleronia sp. LCG004]
MKKSFLLVLAALAPVAAPAAPVEVLFVGNSYTFARLDPVLSYNADNVTSLTSPERGGGYADPESRNRYSPPPWGGVPGIVKKLTDQAGLDYEISLSTRQAASLRGHFLNTNPDDWDLRSNIASKPWDKVILQEQSDEPLPRVTNAFGNELRSNPEYFTHFADVIEDFVHSSDPTGTIRYRDAFPGASEDARQAACADAGISPVTCRRDRGSYANPNANPDADLYLYQTWARPNLVDGALETEIDPETGAAIRTGGMSEETFFASLDEMTALLANAYADAADLAGQDGTGGFTGIAPVGEAFLSAVASGIATRDFWGEDALSDGLIDLWFEDGTHASPAGSYLSALTIFGTITDLDPGMFGAGELAARDLGISAETALLLQGTASRQLGFTQPAIVPLPATGGMLLLGVAGLGAVRRRRRTAPA